MRQAAVQRSRAGGHARRWRAVPLVLQCA